MAKAKKKLLPKEFQSLLETCSVEELKKLFETYDVNARGGYSKQTPLAFPECPDDLVRWLVERGADLNAADSYGAAPLHSRARHWSARVEVLLELGADVHQGEGLRGTPLHAAASACNAVAAGSLLRYGARVDSLNERGETPLTHALRQCSNIQIPAMADLAAMLLAAGAQRTAEMKEFVARIGENFEWHRAGFNRDFLEATNAGLDRLYELFGVTPAPRRVLHDGKSPIVAQSARWQDRHQELWDLLIPSRGAAATVQGEVIRITGKIHRELDLNGGINWDRQYMRMADAFLVHVASGASLESDLLTEARGLVEEVKRKRGDTDRLSELAVEWVVHNPIPQPLPPPDYDR